MRLHYAACAAGETVPLVWEGMGQQRIYGGKAHTIHTRPIPPMPVGTELCDAHGAVQFQVTGRVLIPHGLHAFYFPLLTALQDMAAHEEDMTLQRKGWALAWITLSDTGFAGEREDASGPSIATMVGEAVPLCHSQGFLLPDSIPALRTLIMELALGQGYDVLCTTGGTGLSPRDVSPEATLPLLERRLHGFEQAMMLASLAKTPHAVLSRAVAGVIGRCICINVPGSRKAVVENLAAVLPALPHALDKLHGDTALCGG